MLAINGLVQFRASFPPLRGLRRTLAPVSEQWLEATVAGGAVTVLGKVDLMLGPAQPRRATRILVDLKVGRARGEHPEDMRLYALLYTLRYGVPPLRVATFLLASGEWQAEEVGPEILERASDRVVQAVRAAASLATGASPELIPGPHCRRCPRREACPVAYGEPEERSRAS
jgi:hypothetical protein